MGTNNIVRSESRKSIFPSAQSVVSAAVSFEQGDLLVFDDAANLLKVPTLEADGSTFLGVAVESVVLGKLKKPYSTDVDASSAITDVPGPVYGVIAKCVLKTGSTVAPGDLISLDPASGTRGVQALVTKGIGIYQGAAIVGSAAGLEIEVLLGSRHPGDVLQF